MIYDNSVAILTPLVFPLHSILATPTIKSTRKLITTELYNVEN